LIHHVLFILICLIWGASFILMKVGGSVYTPIAVGAWRVGSAAAAVAMIWLLLGRPWVFKRRDIGPLILISCMGTVVPFIAQPYVINVVNAHSHNGSSFTGTMVALVPLMTIIASAVILKVRPTARQMVGVLGGFTAIAWLFHDELKQGVAPHHLALAALSPMLYAVTNTWIKRRYAGVPTISLLLCTMSITTLILLPAALLIGPTVDTPPPGIERTTMTQAIAALVFLGVVGTGLATFMFYKLVQQRGPLFAGMVTYIIPCVAQAFGFLGGETISTAQIASLGIVFAMVALVQWRHEPTADKRPLPDSPDVQ